MVVGPAHVTSALRYIPNRQADLPTEVHLTLIPKGWFHINLTPFLALGLLFGAMATPLLPANAQTSTTTTTTREVPSGTSSTQTSSDTTAPMTKAERKAQKRQQKHAEKAASESAKAAKDAANNQKHEDTAVREREAAQSQ